MKFQSLEVMGSLFPNGCKIFVLALLAGDLARAEQVERPVLAITNVVTEQSYTFANNIVVSGTLCDDAVIFATESAEITGTVSNDLWLAAAQSAELRGEVGDHARIASVAVIAAGHFARDFAAFGKKITLATNNIIRRDVDLRGENVVIEGEVHGRARVVADVVTISAHIRGDAEIEARKIELLRGARIDGDVTYTSPDELLFNTAHVKVGGKLIHKKPPPVEASQLIRFQLALSAALLISSLLTGLVFLFCLPRFAGNALQILKQSPLRCATTGFFIAGAVAVLAMLTIPSVVLSPFGAVLLTVQGLLMYAGTIVVALALGGLVLRQQGAQHFGRALLALTIGLGLLYSLKSLPIAGLFISVFAWFTGAGALVLSVIHGQRAVAQPPPVPPSENPSV